MFFADVQTTFYTVGIIFMIFLMAVIITFLVMILVIMARIREMKRKAKDKMSLLFSFSRKSKGFFSGFKEGFNK